MIRKLMAAAGVASLLALGMAVPAMAQVSQCPYTGEPNTNGSSCTDVSVSATVLSSLNVTGITTSESFPSLVAGAATPTTVTESYSVSTNDTAGFSDYLTSPNSYIACSGSTCTAATEIADSDMTVTSNGGSPITVQKGNISWWTGVDNWPIANTTSAPSGGTASFSDVWSLQVPSNQAPGSYGGGDLAYVIYGN